MLADTSRGRRIAIAMGRLKLLSPIIGTQGGSHNVFSRVAT